MNCEEAKKLLLGEEPDLPELKAHLLKCRDCAALSRSWSALRAARPAKLAPPLSLDLKICSVAAANANAARLRRRFVKIFAGFGAAAAALAISLSAYFLLSSSPASGKSDAAAEQAAPRAIAWNSVSIGEGLSTLRNDIEKSASVLVLPGRKEPVRPPRDDDSAIQALAVEVPEFLT